MSHKQLGPYTLGERIGKGGMGSVYRAYDEQAGQQVAVKSLSPQLAAAEGFRERFESEIESLKILQHEGIVRLLGFGEDDGVLFYSMELVDGPSLEDEIAAHRRFTWQETLDLGVQICRALKHAHDHGVVHRDIKPANLLLTPAGRIKIADFGIARLFGATQLTTAGGVLGTADYMSPEQADGRPVTDKCDQYSLGCVLYALLAGRPPFRANTMPEMLQLQRFAEAEPVRRYAPETPEQLDQLIRQLLSKDPEHRFPNVLVLARHMEAMQKALARKEQANNQRNDDGPGPETASPTPGGTSAAHPDATLALGDPAAVAESIDLHVAEDVYDAPTMAAEEHAATDHDKRDARDEPAPVTERRFTTVAEEARRASRPNESERLSHWLQLGGLLLALLAIVAIGWTLMRPPTADELYQQIEAASEGNDLRALERHVKAFAEAFPADPRGETLQSYREQVELARLERQAQGRSRLSGAETTHPAESIYVAARQLAPTQPQAAAALLRNLLALYGDGEGVPPGDDEAARLWLALAKRHLAELDAAAEAHEAAARPLIQERLAAAAQLEPTQPDAARGIYRAAIELYGDQPWAADLVARAKTRLGDLGPADAPTE